MEVPEKYAELLRQRGPSVLSVVTRDGSVQSSVVWSDYEEDLISIGMLNWTPTIRNILFQKKATVLKIDPANEDNYICIRCALLRVESLGSIAHQDKMTQRHVGIEKWYGGVVPENDEEQKSCVVIYLKPERVYFT